MRFPEFPGAKSETDVGYRGIKSRFPHRVLVPHEAPLDVVLTDSALGQPEADAGCCQTWCCALNFRVRTELLSAR